MEKIGFVSLWLGMVQSSKDLEELLSISYSDEGDFVPSLFAKYFDINKYDDAVREAEYYEEASSNLKELLEGFSYDETLIKEFAFVAQDALSSKFNTVVLLYNYQYTGKISEASIRSNYFKFYGVGKYQ